MQKTRHTLKNVKIKVALSPRNEIRLKKGSNRQQIPHGSLGASIRARFDLSLWGIPPVAQLVRASSLYLEGPWFESKRADILACGRLCGRVLSGEHALGKLLPAKRASEQYNHVYMWSTGADSML